MEERLELDTRVSPEGRVVIPAAIRKALGLEPGDRVRFVLVNGEVSLVSPRALAFELWAMNHGGDAGESTRTVRAAREQDRDRVADKWDRVAGQTEGAQEKTEEEIAADLLSALGLEA